MGSTLTNAESNVVRLEEENRLKEGYAERVKQMTRSLDQLQKASEKREAMEKKLRYKKNLYYYYFLDFCLYIYTFVHLCFI